MRAQVGPGTMAAMGLASLAAASKVLGLVRELILAWAFGTSAMVDAFRIGLTYTTFSSHLFFGEAMSGTLVPRLGRLDDQNNAHVRQATNVKAGITLGAICTMIPLGLLFLLAPGMLLDLLAPDLGLEQRARAVSFLRVFGLGIPLYSLTAVAIMVRQAASNFSPLGLRPAGQNAFLIIGIIAASATGKPIIIPATFVAYYALLLALLSPGELVGSLAVGARTAMHTLRSIATTWFPLAIGLMLVRSNIIVERYFGSRLPTGSISALDYARTITDLPLLLLAVPAGAVLLTKLSRTPHGGIHRGLRRKLMAIMVAAVAWTLLVVTFARPLTSLLLERGAFDASSTAATSTAVMGLGIGAWALVLSHIVTQYFMATSSRWSIIIAGAISFAANVGLAVVLVPSFGLFGLALASAASPIVYGLFGLGVTTWRMRRGSEVYDHAGQ